MLLILGFAFWTPDTSVDDMTRKYGGSASQFIGLADNSRIHYRDQGTSNKPTLVLIHGTSASLHTWEPLVELLGDRFRLISFDLPGHGLTGVNTKRDYSREAMVKTVWAVMDHLDVDAATIVGNSLGGSIAWASALDRPERVESLILVAPSGSPIRAAAKSNIGFNILKTTIGQSLMKNIAPRFIIKSSLNQTVSVPGVIDDVMVDRYWELLRLKGNRQAMIDLANTPRDENAWMQFSSISAPVMMIWGEEDGLLPVAMLKTFEDEIENIRSKTLPGVGHLPMEEAAEIVAQDIVTFCALNNC